MLKGSNATVRMPMAISPAYRIVLTFSSKLPELFFAMRGEVIRLKGARTKPSAAARVKQAGRSRPVQPGYGPASGNAEITTCAKA